MKDVRGFQATCETTNANLQEKLYMGPVLKKEFHWLGLGAPNRSLCAKTAARVEWDTEHLKVRSTHACPLGRCRAWFTADPSADRAERLSSHCAHVLQAVLLLPLLVTAVRACLLGRLVIWRSYMRSR